MNNKFSKVVIYSVAVIFLISMLITVPASADERLVIKDSSDKVFSFTNDGLMSLNQDSSSPGFLGSRTWAATRMDIGYGGDGGGNLECYSKNHSSRPGQFKFIYGGGTGLGEIVFTNYDGSSWHDTMSLDYSGKLDIQGSIYVGTAYCDGGEWVNGSSREYKENIKDLSSQDAIKALKELEPVSYVYKKDPSNQRLGFIAEDVPEIVATKNRKGVAAINFVALLTKVVQDQQKSIVDLTRKLETLQQKLELSENE